MREIGTIGGIPKHRLMHILAWWDGHSKLFQYVQLPTKYNLEELATQVERYSRKIDKMASLLLKVLQSTPLDPTLREKIVKEIRELGYEAPKGR